MKPNYWWPSKEFDELRAAWRELGRVIWQRSGLARLSAWFENRRNSDSRGTQ